MKNIQPIPKKKNCEQKTTVQSAKNDIFTKHLPRLAIPSDIKRSLHEDLPMVAETHRKVWRRWQKFLNTKLTNQITEWAFQILSSTTRWSNFTNNSSIGRSLHCLLREILVFYSFCARFSFYQTLLKFSYSQILCEHNGSRWTIGKRKSSWKFKLKNVVALRMLLVVKPNEYFKLSSSLFEITF